MTIKHGVSGAHLTTDAEGGEARFLTSQNPAQMKRNVLASFTNVLLMPVTLVPKTVGAVGGAAVGMVGGVGAMLNPQRWAGGRVREVAEEGYAHNFEGGGEGWLHDNDADDEPEEQEQEQEQE